MHGTLVVALNRTRITQDIYFEVPSSMVELLIEVLNKILLFRQQVRYYGIEKNNCATELMCLPVSASNSL